MLIKKVSSMRREKRKQIIVLFIVVIFFGSTVAFAVLQALGFSSQEPVQPTTISEERIFESSDRVMENLFVQYGYTIAVLNYNGTCCQDTVLYLEGMSSENNGQIAVFKDIKPNITQKSLKISSLAGTVVLINEEITREEIFNKFCETMMSAPLECGLQHINTSTKNTFADATSSFI